MSSTKSMHGHPLGAGGGIEAVACIKAMEDNWVPPTIGLDEADPECDLDYVPNVGRAKKVTYTMSNSFAFGGLNAVLVIRAATRLGITVIPAEQPGHAWLRKFGTQLYRLFRYAFRPLGPGYSLARIPG